MAPPGRRRHNLSPAALFLGLVFLFGSTASAASAVLGVDLGTEYFKAALVKPGIPLEIVLTKDSKRKELSAVAFKPSKNGALAAGEFPERFYGSDAAALQARFPADVYPNLKQLLGVRSDAEVVQTYKSRYPALNVGAVEKRETVALKSGVFAESELPFSVEELLAMELQNVKENAKALAGKGVDISDVVFTVPPFYTVEERRALEVAAKLADLKVLGTVSDGLAVGINYATSRTFPVVNEGGKPEINLVFDMGAGSASATVLKFQGRTVKDIGKRNKTIQEVQVMGTGWDRTLGGDALNQLIVDDMVSAFVDSPAAKSASITAEKVKSHGRTAAKLFKDAEKTRQVLSANTQTSAFFESLYEDVDLRYKITRAHFEELAADLAARVQMPIEAALEAAGALSIDDIDSVIVHGGASRTPFVQQRLEAIFGKGKIKANVNSDEAAVFGAAFKAAGLSPSFRVKEIRDSDIQGYTHGIKYMFNVKERDQKIFTPSSKIGATKDLPFQMMGEFEFSLYQAAPNDKGEIVKDTVLHFISGNVTRVVTKMIDEDKCDRDSFNNYVQVRLSPVTGVPEVLGAWVTCETEEAKSGIVDGVKNFFGMGDKKDQEPLKEGESSSESTSESSSSSKSSKSSKTSSSTASEASASEAAKPKKKLVRSAHTYTVTMKGYEKHPRKEFKRMQDRLAAFDASEKSRRVREEILNSLEAFTYRARDHLEDEGFIGASTAEVRSKLEDLLSATSDWIYGEGHDAPQDVLKAKLKELEDIVKPILKRKTEAVDRPEALKKLESNLADINNVAGIVQKQIDDQNAALAKSSEAASKASAASASATPSASSDSLEDLDDDELLRGSATEAAPEPETTPVSIIYTEDDIKTIEELHRDTKKWLDEKKAAQDKLSATDDPVLLVEDMNARTAKLEQAVFRMMTKKANFLNAPKQQKPKAKPKPKKKTSKKGGKKDKAGEAAKEPSQEELDAALKKAGLDKEGVKLKSFGVGKDKEVRDKDGKLLNKLELDADASEEDILAAIDKAVKEGRERVEKEKEEKREKGSDEL